MFMQDLTQRLQAVCDTRIRFNLFRLFEPTIERFRTVALANSTLVIKAVSSALAKTGAAASYFSVRGKLVTIAAGTDMPALSGTVTNAAFNVYVFYVDESGTKTSKMGTEGATLAAVTWPKMDAQKAIIGFIVINPTGTGNFVGGTTALDDATVVPNAAYVSPTGMWDPTARI
jgi:hypothetical protein